MFRKTVLVHALSLAFSAAVISIAMPVAVHAASNTAGSVNGRAVSGSVITIENKEIGLKRTIEVGKEGSFQVPQLPPGSYTLSAVYKDGTKEEQNVSVSAGEGATANFDGAKIQQVVVAGVRSRIDIKSPESSMVLNKAAIDRIPVLRDVTAVALLAPGATAGDTRIGQTNVRGGNVPSLGGASPAENVYYINGFNVTNSLNGVAFNQVPFDAIAQQQVKTGGYGAEYGRSLGGVLSVTTKRGTNAWHGGANIIVVPESLKGSQVYAEKSPVTGQWLLADKEGGTNDLKANAWVGGPVIEDKLFFFGLVQAADIKRDTYGSSDQDTTTSKTPLFLTKFDWNINDKNLLEFTAFSDKSEDKVANFKSTNPYGTAREFDKGVDTFTTGGENYIAKYTSWITDDLTISGLAGLGKYNRKSDISSAACPFVRDDRAVPRVSYGCWTQSVIADPNANDERKAYRLDAEWNLGKHNLRFGMDNEEYNVVDGTVYPGGDRYQIKNLTAGSTLGNGYQNTTGATIPFVQIRHFENGGTFKTKNSAFYLEDNWQVHKNVVANLGVRSESFTNLNASGDTFIEVKNTIAPRLGVSWDVRGNAQTKVFANAGRYYIPVMSNTNVRLAGTELDYTDFYQWNGTFGADKKQIPDLGAQLGARQSVSNGEAKDPRTVVDPNIKPMYQDEFILGIQQAFGNRWTLGAKVTHRNLKSVMDDMCNDEGAYDWAIANSYTADQADAIAGTVGHCFLYNPGGALTANVDLGDGKGLTPVTISADALKFPKPKRVYNALELGFERAWDGKWSLQGSYVLSSSKGNAEGYVKSDIGQDDAGISQDWDYPGLMEGAEGYLPNDRRHTFKAFGSYQVAEEWRLGGNVVVQSGRPKNCLGFYNGNLDGVSVYYGAASFYCDGVLHPRGSFGRLPWSRNLSLQVTYEPKWYKGLTFQVDALNIFNERTVTSIQEQGEDALHSPSPAYQQPIGIQAARSFRFTAQYEF
jgi:outer membrane receptor for ferrienterochelin and colicin